MAVRFLSVVRSMTSLMPSPEKLRVRHSQLNLSLIRSTALVRQLVGRSDMIKSNTNEKCMGRPRIKVEYGMS